MFAQFFFLALYMQNILHYSPLQTGVRFLPSTIVIIIMGPLAGRLTDRVGSRPLMIARPGRSSPSSLFISRGSPSTRGYGLLLPGFVLMGLGMGLVDVADEHCRDERRRPDQGRRGVRACCR